MHHTTFLWRSDWEEGTSRHDMPNNPTIPCSSVTFCLFLPSSMFLQSRRRTEKKRRRNRVQYSLPSRILTSSICLFIVFQELPGFLHPQKQKRGRLGSPIINKRALENQVPPDVLDREASTCSIQNKVTSLLQGFHYFCVQFSCYMSVTSVTFPQKKR